MSKIPSNPEAREMIQRAAMENRIEITFHAGNRTLERAYTYSEVIDILRTGVVAFDQLDDRKGPKYHVTKGRRRLVASLGPFGDGEPVVYVVTALPK